jgi:hypothetical protein
MLKRRLQSRKDDGQLLHDSSQRHRTLGQIGGLGAD